MTNRTFIDQLSGISLHRDPAWEEAKQRLWAMTADERRASMYAGTLPFRLCLHWANHAPREVPRLNGELWFIAIRTPEVLDTNEANTSPSTRTPACRP